MPQMHLYRAVGRRHANDRMRHQCGYPVVFVQPLVHFDGLGRSRNKLYLQLRVIGILLPSGCFFEIGGFLLAEQAALDHKPFSVRDIQAET